MKLIVGLGNPGVKYSLTRHNMGFVVVDEVARLNNIKFRLNRRFKSFTGEGRIGTEISYLAKPQQFMNLSGHSVRSIVNWLKIELDKVLLIVDDIALPFGQIRIRSKGSDGGHKGLRSAIDCLGMDEFSRMRIGIRGRKIVRDCPGYVLGRFTKREQKTLPDILREASQACECWANDGISAAMNNYNRKLV